MKGNIDTSGDTDFYQAQPREQLNLTGKYEIGSVANIYATTGY